MAVKGRTHPHARGPGLSYKQHRCQVSVMRLTRTKTYQVDENLGVAERASSCRRWRTMKDSTCTLWRWTYRRHRPPCGRAQHGWAHLRSSPSRSAGLAGAPWRSAQSGVPSGRRDGVLETSTMSSRSWVLEARRPWRRRVQQPARRRTRRRDGREAGRCAKRCGGRTWCCGGRVRRASGASRFGSRRRRDGPWEY